MCKSAGKICWMRRKHYSYDCSHCETFKDFNPWGYEAIDKYRGQIPHLHVWIFFKFIHISGHFPFATNLFLFNSLFAEKQGNWLVFLSFRYLWWGLRKLSILNCPKSKPDPCCESCPPTLSCSLMPKLACSSQQPCSRWLWRSFLPNTLPAALGQGI